MTRLTDFADALVTGLRSRLPDIPTISADPPSRKERSLRMPAIYLEIEDIETLQAAGDSRLLADVRWNALCLFDPSQPRADLLLRELVTRVAVALHDMRRPIPSHGHLRLMRASDDPFRPSLDGYLCWVVEFGIEIALGELEPEGVTPSEIYLGTNIDGDAAGTHASIT